jgi:pSer/pThr/pTyr-binding forkhead associated (FHA) protein
MNVPHYPVIYVDLRADGSAHLNLAGRHIDYPPAPLADTRTAITRYATDIAVTLGRPVRMNSTGRDGTFTVAVHPTGTVTDLTTSTPPTQRPAPPAPTPAPPTAHPADVDAIQLVSTRRAAPIVTLTLDTGGSVTIAHSALIGRHPLPSPDNPTEQLIQVRDATRTLSKTHFRIHHTQDRFTITDQGSANGTTLHRADAPPRHLRPHQAYDLRDNDVIAAGEVTFHVTVTHRPETEIRS